MIDSYYFIDFHALLELRQTGLLTLVPIPARGQVRKKSRNRVIERSTEASVSSTWYALTVFYSDFESDSVTRISHDFRCQTT